MSLQPPTASSQRSPSLPYIYLSSLHLRINNPERAPPADPISSSPPTTSPPYPSRSGEPSVPADSDTVLRSPRHPSSPLYSTTISSSFFPPPRAEAISPSSCTDSRAPISYTVLDPSTRGRWCDWRCATRRGGLPAARRTRLRAWVSTSVGYLSVGPARDSRVVSRRVFPCRKGSERGGHRRSRIF